MALSGLGAGFASAGAALAGTALAGTVASHIDALAATVAMTAATDRFIIPPGELRLCLG
jgi:hypothetical protein